MLLIPCPWCGPRAEIEFRCGGEAHIRRPDPDTADDAAWEAYLFLRTNPKGVHLERWRHAMGCGKWFHAARCTMTLEVFGTYAAQTIEPPKEIRDKISDRRPGWSWRTFS